MLDIFSSVEMVYMCTEGQINEYVDELFMGLILHRVGQIIHIFINIVIIIIKFMSSEYDYEISFMFMCVLCYVIVTERQTL